MRRLSIFAAYVIAAVLAMEGFLLAQSPVTGTPPFSSIGGGPSDAVNLGNLLSD